MHLTLYSAYRKIKKLKEFRYIQDKQILKIFAEYEIVFRKNDLISFISRPNLAFHSFV